MGPSQMIHLPDGQTFIVKPVFAGLSFRSHELNTDKHPYPIGWTTVLHTEEVHEVPVDDDDDDDDDDDNEAGPDGLGAHNGAGKKRRPTRRRRRLRPFTLPTAGNDTLFISSIAHPAESEFRPAASPTRQMAMLLWVTLYWYFQQRPRPGGPADWLISIRPDGALRGRNLMPKLERMGLVASRRPAVAPADDDDAGDDDNPLGLDMFVSERMFWQMPARLFLFTLEPMQAAPASPSPSLPHHALHQHQHHGAPASPTLLHPAPDRPPSGPPSPMLAAASSLPLAGPCFASEQVPIYFPPPPLQYVRSAGGVRHPLRARPPCMGEVFYTRFVPSQGQYLAFRVASSAPGPVPYSGPVGPDQLDPRRPTPPPQQRDRLLSMSDAALLRRWHGSPRVAEFWGPFEPAALDRALGSAHSFPVIGLWDGLPFGYFELYWAREDLLGRHADVADWDRGVHVMVGEEWARGRVPAWLTSLLHWCFMADPRTMSVCLEPRVDNSRMLRHLDALGFVREKQVALPHKTAWYVSLRRESWESPAL